MQRERQNNIELCRVCVMLFIVIHHCIVSGLGLNETLNDGGENFSSATICLIVMNAFVIVSVNVFFLIRCNLCCVCATWCGKANIKKYS